LENYLRYSDVFGLFVIGSDTCKTAPVGYSPRQERPHNDSYRPESSNVYLRFYGMEILAWVSFFKRKDQSPELVFRASRNNISESFRPYRIFSLGKIACHFDTLWFYRLLLLQKKES
jgi:hypothetical protein